MFIVFDGIDGAGKSTQLNQLVAWLQNEHGHDVVTCKDPGSTELGERLRGILLGDHDTVIDMRSEMLMFMTARAQLVAEVIRPALNRSQTVVCDRYVFSTVVYQGHAGELDPEQVWQVNHVATGGLMADLTFILDLDVDVCMQRIGENRDRMESRSQEYFEKVRSGFLLEAERWPQGVEVINARQTPDEVQSELRKRTTAYLTNLRTK